MTWEEATRRARRMAMEMKGRLERGDTLRVGWALDRLSEAANYRTEPGRGGHLIDYFLRIDGDLWFNIVFSDWGRRDAELLIATGKTREEWLAGL